jgi:hypothetical protein
VRPGRSGQIRRSPSVGRGPGAGERHPVGRTGGAAPPRLHRLSALQGRGLRAGGGGTTAAWPGWSPGRQRRQPPDRGRRGGGLTIGGGVRAVLPAATLIGTAVAEKRCRSRETGVLHRIRLRAGTPGSPGPGGRRGSACPEGCGQSASAPAGTHHVGRGCQLKQSPVPAGSRIHIRAAYRLPRFAPENGTAVDAAAQSPAPPSPAHIVRPPARRTSTEKRCHRETDECRLGDNGRSGDASGATINAKFCRTEHRVHPSAPRESFAAGSEEMCWTPIVPPAGGAGGMVGASGGSACASGRRGLCVAARGGRGGTTAHRLLISGGRSPGC